MQQAIKLNTEILSKAAANQGLSLDEFARHLYKKEEIANKIAKGFLTFAQAKKFAEKSKMPFGYLFLEKPPQEFKVDASFVDFRTRTNHDPLSPGFMKTLRDVQHKQDWYRNYLISNGAEKLSFVGIYANKKNIDNTEIAKEIRNTLNIDKIKAYTVSDYYSALSEACENVGILVFKNSIVINNTKNSLNPEEFDGFVIADDYVPCVFINGAASKHANIFTLAHELAHIWLGESGISDSAIDSKNLSEARCNAIAAEVLVPQNEFTNLWEEDNSSTLEKIRYLNKHFKVSELVIARTALSLKKIGFDIYKQVAQETDKAWQEYRKETKGAPRAIYTVSTRNSKKLTKTVIDLLRADKMMPRQAGILLNKPAARVGDL